MAGPRKVLHKTRRKVRSVMNWGAAGHERSWPSFDLREDLRKEVQKAHRHVDQVLERADRLRAHYKEDHNVRWLESAEKLHLDEALHRYRAASRRAALLTRLFNVAQRHRRMETCERHVMAFIARHIADKPLSRPAEKAASEAARALYRYLFVATDRNNDRAFRAAWMQLGRRLASKGFDNAFLFELPEPRPARRPSRR